MSLTLPNFLCIGAPKCGSTWLQKLLETHPQVYIPTELNEIHFFDRNFGSGVDWYANFFSERKDTHVAVGEVTPHYLYAAPERVKTVRSVEKLILIYRDPVDRIISHYKFRMRMDAYQGSFPQFLNDYPEALTWSQYGVHLNRFLEHYRRDQFLFLRFEDATKQLDKTKHEVAEFLGIDAALFPVEAGTQVVNEGFLPKRRRLYSMAVTAGKWLADRGLYGVRNQLKKSFIHRFLRRSSNSESSLNIEGSTLNELRR